MGESYTLYGPQGFYTSDEPGALGGRKASARKQRVYGTKNCPSALQALSNGDAYEKARVFFADEETAIAAGFRPCFRCMKERYEIWKRGGEPGTAEYPWLILP